MGPGAYTNVDYDPNEITVWVVKEPLVEQFPEEEDTEDIMLLADPQVQEDLRQSAFDIVHGDLVEWGEVPSQRDA